MRSLLWFLVIVLGLVAFIKWQGGTPEAQAYNARQCAVYGMTPDECANNPITAFLRGTK